jgi:hypothetical protein
MPSPNEVKLADAFVKPENGIISDETIKNNQRFQIVAEVEAGSALFTNLQPHFQLISVVTDKSDSPSPTTIATQTVAGNIGQGAWNTQAAEISFPLIAAQGATKNNHIYEASVVLVVGAGDPSVEFAENIKFVITAP